MGGRGSTPKPDRRGSRVVHRPKKPELRAVGKLEAPAPPDGLLEEMVAWWNAYWASQLAKAVQADSDLPALRRLATLMDQRERTYRALQRVGPVAEGSQGQDVLHPLTRYMGQLDAEIRQLEDRFGLSPRARLAIGLQLTQTRRGLEDLYEFEQDQGQAPVIDIAGRELSVPEG